MAEKFDAMRPHSEGPLTASVPANFHYFAATPNDRLLPGRAGLGRLCVDSQWPHTLTVLDAPFKGICMDTSYRIPHAAVKPEKKTTRRTRHRSVRR
ncbi:MAG TPA: hypothetical protein VK642_02750 [Burkholderiales bacterium]|nr:hypothetical protein [Burkholderiales bacterium]